MRNYFIQNVAEISTYFVLNKQPLFACLKPAGGTKRIAVIGKSTKHFCLCKSIRPYSTITFFSTYHCFLGSTLNPVTLESSAYRSKTSASMMRSRQVIAIRKSVWRSRKRETQSHRKVMSYWFDRLPREIGQAESLWLFKRLIKEVL